MLLIDEIDSRYVLKEPPELTRQIAAARWKEINLLIHSMVLLGDEMDGRAPLLPLLRSSAAIAACRKGLFYRWDDATGSLRLAASLGMEPDAVEALAAGNRQARGCLLHRKPVMVGAPRDRLLSGEMELLGASAALSIPISHQGMPWGALQLLRDRQFLSDEAVLLWLFGMILEGVLPVLIGSRRHQEMTSPADPATGLLTPEHFRRRLDWEVRRSGWLALPLSVICIEVSEMLHGRPRGSSLTFTPRQAARAIVRSLRRDDFVTCLGGHHFIGALPDTGPEEARQLEGPIHEGLLACAGGTLPVFDISTGRATFPDDGIGEAELIRAACADTECGRGRVSRNPRVS